MVVIESILERTNEYSFEYLNNNNESKLLDIVENLLNIDSNDYYNNKQYYVTKSNDILTQNIDKYNNHINNIDKISKSEFVLNYAKFVKSQTPTWELDFKKQLY